MRRLQEIENFLKSFANLIMNNPYYKINYDKIYTKLANYDIDYSQIDADLQSEFNKWIKKNENNPYNHIKVFFNKNNDSHSDSKLSKCFLHFVNYKGDYKKIFKIYLSLPKDKIYNGVNYLFDFIDKKDFEMYSKVVDHVRSDDVVMRVTDKKDLKKIIDYINSNSYYSNNCNRTNPFMMRNGIVGFSYGETEGYNLCISQILNMYFSNLVKNNNLENCNLTTFQNYIDDLYKNTFVNKKNLNNFNFSIINGYDNYKDDSEKLLVYKKIIEFLKYAVRGDFDYKNYCKFVEHCRDEKNNDKIKDSFRKVLINKNVSAEEIRNVFFKASLFTCYKYNKEQLYFALNHAINGNYNGFPNGDNNYRKKLFEIVPNEYVKNICLYYIGMENENLSDSDIFEKYCNVVEERLAFIKNELNIENNNKKIH